MNYKRFLPNAGGLSRFSGDRPRRMLPVLLCLLLAAALICGCGGTPTGSDVDGQAYKIGAVVDISGSASSLGEPERDTLKMLADELNAQGGIDGHPVELIILDNKSVETEAVLAAKKLIEQDKVLAIIGCSTSGPSLAMVDTAQKAGVPMISLAASALIVEPAADRQWVFKTAQGDRTVADRIAGYLADRGLTDVAFLSMNNSFGDSGRAGFEEAAAARGINIILKEKFEATDKDMTAQLAKVKASPAQATVIWAIPPSAAIVTKNYHDLGLDIPLLQSHGIANQAFLDLAGPAADGVIAPVSSLIVAEQLPDSDPQKTLLLEYISSYQGLYNAEPSAFGGYAHDAFRLVVQAIGEAGPDRAAIRDALETTTGFVGITGIFNLSAEDHNGLDESSLALVEVRDGRWTLLP